MKFKTSNGKVNQYMNESNSTNNHHLNLSNKKIKQNKIIDITANNLLISYHSIPITKTASTFFSPMYWMTFNTKTQNYLLLNYAQSTPQYTLLSFLSVPNIKDIHSKDLLTPQIKFSSLLQTLSPVSFSSLITYFCNESTMLTIVLI